MAVLGSPVMVMGTAVAVGVNVGVGEGVAVGVWVGNGVEVAVGTAVYVANPFSWLLCKTVTGASRPVDLQPAKREKTARRKTAVLRPVNHSSNCFCMVGKLPRFSCPGH
jgi:hypothetical protein